MTTPRSSLRIERGVRARPWRSTTTSLSSAGAVVGFAGMTRFAAVAWFAGVDRFSPVLARGAERTRIRTATATEAADHRPLPDRVGPGVEDIEETLALGDHRPVGGAERLRFEDHELAELKRQIQEQINTTLDMRAVEQVIITDLEVIRADKNGPQPSTVEAKAPDGQVGHGAAAPPAVAGNQPNRGAAGSSPWETSPPQ